MTKPFLLRLHRSPFHRRPSAHPLRMPQPPKQRLPGPSALSGRVHGRCYTLKTYEHPAPSPSPAEPRPTSHPSHPAPNVARSHPRSPRRILDSLRRATSLAAAAAAASLPWHASLKIHSAARVLRRDKASTPAATNPRRWCLRRALSRQDHKHLDRRSADNLRAADADATSAARGLARRRVPKLQARTARDRRSALILAAAMEARRRARAASLRVLSARAARRRSLPLRNAWAAARESRDARALLSRRWPSAACCRRALSEA